MKVALILILTVMAALAVRPAWAQERCGETVTLSVRGQTLAYSYRPPDTDSAPIAALVLLPGGGGVLDLDEMGCARALTGNTLTRNVARLRAAGFATALVDAPSDHRGDDGLGGFRANLDHANDLGAVITSVRSLSPLPIYVVGSSRGTISAVNAAARLSENSAPAGVILFSPITSGFVGGRKPWVAQTVFDLPLGNIRQPILVVAHEGDACVRTPPAKARDILPRTNGSVEEMVMVTSGQGTDPGVRGVQACQGRMPHGFGGEDERVVKLISDFVRKTAQP